MKSLTVAGTASVRRTWEAIDKSTGQAITIQPGIPSAGDQVLIKHNGALKVGTETAAGVTLRDSGETIEKPDRVGKIK